jgi:hypothetical protein
MPHSISILGPFGFAALCLAAITIVFCVALHCFGSKFWIRFGIYGFFLAYVILVSGVAVSWLKLMPTDMLVDDHPAYNVHRIRALALQLQACAITGVAVWSTTFRKCAKQ